MEDFELTNEKKITQKEWKELMAFKEEYQEDLRTRNLLLQKINDNLEGGLTSRNLASFRNTYIVNAQDSLDNYYPMHVHFNILDEMIKIVSIKVNFWILPFRSYYITTGANTGHTSNNESATLGAPETIDAYPIYVDSNGDPYIDDGSHESKTINPIYHTHSVHAHAYGIFEEDNSPTIGFQISKDNGKTYGAILGQYTIDIKNLEIRDYITASGSYIIKFTSSARAKLSVQVTIKLDIKAR